MKELTRKNCEEMKMRKDGRQSGTFQPLIEIPIDTAEWYDAILEAIKENHDLSSIEDDEIIAETKIDKVSYVNPETNECDVRWEARYEVTV